MGSEMCIRDSFITQLINIHKPLYDAVLNSPYRFHILLSVLIVGCLAGIIYRAVNRSEYDYYSYTHDEGMTGWVLYGIGGALCASVVAVLIVPLCYIALITVISYVLWDGITVCWNAWKHVFYPAKFSILWWSFVFVSIVVLVFWKRHDLLTAWPDLTYRGVLRLLGMWAFMSFMFGVLRHRFYAGDDKEKQVMIASSWWLTGLRYLHVNWIWGLCLPFYDLVIALSTSHTAGQIAFAGQQHTIEYRMLQQRSDDRIDRANVDMRDLRDEITSLKKQVRSRGREVERLRGNNQELRENVDHLKTKVITLNEQNTELHQQWIDALQNTGVVDDGVVDLDDLFTDED